MSETIFDDAGTTFRAAVAAIQGMNPRISEPMDYDDGTRALVDLCMDSELSTSGHEYHSIGFVEGEPMHVTFVQAEDLTAQRLAVFQREVSAVSSAAHYLNAFPGDKLSEAKRLAEAAQQDYPQLVSDGDDVQKALHVVSRYAVHEMTTSGLMPSLYPSLDPQFIESMQAIAAAGAHSAPADGDLLKAFRVLDENASEEHQAWLAGYVARFGTDHAFEDRPDCFRPITTDDNA